MTTIVNTLSTIILSVVSNNIYDEKNKIIDNVKLNELKKETEKWIEDYCMKNDESILTTSAFQNFIIYQNPISKLFNYATNPSVQISLEDKFIGELIEDCQRSISSSGKTFTVNDESILRELFTKILDRYKEFLENKLNIQDKYSLHLVGQMIKSETDGIIKEIHAMNGVTKEICDMLKQKEEICEDKKMKIYFSLSNILWQGNIEGIYDILPLVEAKNQELDVALKMNLNMISDYDIGEQYTLDALENIKCEDIKKDIVRKYILLHIENYDFLKKLKNSIEDSCLRQIIEDIEKKDFTKIFNVEKKVQYGVEVKSISKNQYYSTEQGLVAKIAFMYLYNQNDYGVYSAMRELVKKDINVLEELLIWEKQELELINEYALGGKVDDLRKLYNELRSNLSRYLRLKLEYRKKYYFILLRSAVVIDHAEVNNIIENLPDSIKSDIDIQELILLSKIKEGVAVQGKVVKFCQKTKSYMVLYDYLIQWINAPEKIISFVEDYRYILSEHLAIFLLYIQAVRIVKGSECSKKICATYKNIYGDYLEYMLELYQDDRKKSILDEIVMKKKKGSLLCLNYQIEEVLIEVFMHNGMYDDAMEIIEKYEVLQKMTPQKLRMKAAILLAKEKVLQSLNTFLDIFEVYKEDSYVIINILNISLQYKRVIPRDVMFYAEKSDNVNILVLVAMVYARDADFKLSRKFMTKALLRSDINDRAVFAQYWGMQIEQEDNSIVQITNVDKDTAVFLKDTNSKDVKIYCIYSDDVLPKEPYEWESAIHIYKEYAIKLGVFRKKVGDNVNVGQSDYIITEIMPIDCFLVRKCIAKMVNNGMAKSFHFDERIGRVENQKKFLDWLQKNTVPQNEFDWLEYYKDFSQMPTTFYSLYKFSKLTYEQFVLAMLNEKNVVIRNMLNEDRESDYTGYVLTFSAMVILYKIGVSTKMLKEKGVIIPSSILQFVKDELTSIVNTNAREIVATMGVCEGKLFVNNTPEEEKQYWMEESVKVKDYAADLPTVDNYVEINCSEFGNENLKNLFGICDYDAMAISRETKRRIITGEATLILLSKTKKLSIFTVDILNFLMDIQESAKNIIFYMKRMMELRLMVIVSKRAVNYISEHFLSSGEKEQEDILEEWDDFLTSIKFVGDEYKSIFIQITTDIMKDKFFESTEFDSDVWRLFARYVFRYNGFSFKYEFNEKGEFGIQAYRKVEPD